MPASCYNELWGLGTYSKDAAAETEHRLQETSGTTASDSSGNSRNGTYVGMGTDPTTTTGPKDYLPSAVVFDGSNDHVSLPAISESWTEGTIFAWIKRSGNQSNGDGIVAIRGRLSLQMNGTRMVYGFTDSPSEWGTNYFEIGDATWTRVCLTVFPAGMKMYKDGVLTSSNSVTHGTSHLTGKDFFIGRDLSRYFNGSLAGTASFSRAVTEDEAAEDAAGPEPLNSTAGTVQVQSGDPVVGCILEVGTAPTYDSQSNGTVTITYRWFVNDVYQSTGATFDTTGLSVDDVIKFQSRGTNNGGYDPAEDTDSSNTITLVSASSPIEATLTATLDGVTGSAAASAPITGGVTASLDGVTGSATASAPIAAGVTAILDGVTASATAAGEISAEVTATLDGVTAIATASGAIVAGVTATLDGATANAAASAPITAGVTASLDGVTVAATAGTGDAVSATLTATLDGVTASATASGAIAAGVTSTLDGVSVVSATSAAIAAGVTAQLDGVTVTATAGAGDSVTATVTATLDGVTAAAEISSSITAGLTSTLDGVTAVGSISGPLTAGVTAILDGVSVQGTIGDPGGFQPWWASGANVWLEVAQ